MARIPVMIELALQIMGRPQAVLRMTLQVSYAYLLVHNTKAGTTHSKLKLSNSLRNVKISLAHHCD